MDGSGLGNVLDALSSIRPLTPDEIARSRGFEANLQIEAVYASNALDGNVLTLDETAGIIRSGLAAGGKPLRDQLEAIEHIEALRYIDELIASSSELTSRPLREIHAMATRRSRPELAGRYRTVPVVPAGGDYTPPDAVFVPESIDGLLADYASRRDAEHPVILAADLHQGIVDIRPFEHGNGRTARLAMNLHLMQNGYPLTIIYPEDRDHYEDAIVQTRNTNAPHAFRLFLIDSVRRSLERYLNAL